MKIVNIVLIVLYLISAGLQYNDPDPYIWVPIYLYAAFICYQSIKLEYNPTLYIIGFSVYILYAIYLFFDKTGVLNWAQEHDAESIVQSMKASTPWIEETREFGGLLICILGLLINMIWLRKRKIKIII